MTRLLAIIFILLPFSLALQLSAQNEVEHTNKSKFRQISDLLPTPNVYRTASGAPGHGYWQQKADYVIDVEINDENQVLKGHEVITYHNNSPDPLTYLWVQLDQNVREQNSLRDITSTNSIDNKMSFEQVERIKGTDYDGGFKITAVKDAKGGKLPYVINYTMMRIDLPQSLNPGEKVTFSIDWWYNINNVPEIGGRGGYEYFPEDGNYLYEMAQWFPRMCVYSDFEGWQNKQFLGRGEFALPFGDYTVNITVPDDHIVAATGVLQNEKTVLSKAQQERLAKARTADKPVLIVSEEEARENEKTKGTGKKTWTFWAENVRDFAFASSRKFIWDAKNQPVNGRNILCMSFYPKEGNPLWGQYSTEVVAHTIDIYSKFTIDYPYPVAQSIHGPVYGMEYPMISFNGGRPEADGTYSERTKYGMISVIMHEVGHNFFPMIINSDERQWTWMDEGLNTFVQFLAEKEWDRDYPSRRGPARNIVPYMKGAHETMVPIMSQSDVILQFGNNGYGKPATALNILRETVMGRELFDYAFKEYCRRWAFKHPTPGDLFRTMEDASGVDLDWFWRGWFFTTDNVDISLDAVKWFKVDSRDPKKELSWKKQQIENEPMDISDIRNEKDIPKTKVENNPELTDFYSNYDPLAMSSMDDQTYKAFVQSLTEDEKKLMDEGLNVYQLNFSNQGGLVMPVIVEFQYKDGTSDLYRIPAEIWRYNNKEISKVFFSPKEVERIIVDPYLETADVNTDNNYFPRVMAPSKFEMYKQKHYNYPNPMQRSSN